MKKTIRKNTFTKIMFGKNIDKHIFKIRLIVILECIFNLFNI